jgi:hypothetical protein
MRREHTVSTAARILLCFPSISDYQCQLTPHTQVYIQICARSGYIPAWRKGVDWIDQNLFKNVIVRCRLPLRQPLIRRWHPRTRALWRRHKEQSLQLGKRLLIGTNCQTACVTGSENGIYGNRDRENQNHLLVVFSYPCCGGPRSSAGVNFTYNWRSMFCKLE